MSYVAPNHRLFTFVRKHERLLGLWSDLENTIYSKKLSSDVHAPIFVCGLARAGTTIVTRILNEHRDTASLVYADLPFIEAPILWSNVSKWYYGSRMPAERLHADGIKNDLHSPDAFEELIWKKHLEDYANGGFCRKLDESYRNEPFEKEHASVIAKTIYVRGDAARYVAKGNYNLFRLRYLGKLYPDAKFIICFRNPTEQAKSLTRVHERFVALSRDRTSLPEELQLLGHFEFGPQRKCISGPRKERALEHWRNGDNAGGYLEQWIDAYEHAVNAYGSDPRVCWFSHERLLEDPKRSLKKLLRHCEMNVTDTAIDELGSGIEAKNTYDSEDMDIPGDAKKTYVIMSELERSEGS